MVGHFTVRQFRFFTQRFFLMYKFINKVIILPIRENIRNSIFFSQRFKDILLCWCVRGPYLFFLEFCLQSPRKSFQNKKSLQPEVTSLLDKKRPQKPDTCLRNVSRTNNVKVDNRFSFNQCSCPYFSLILPWTSMNCVISYKAHKSITLNVLLCCKEWS